MDYREEIKQLRDTLNENGYRYYRQDQLAELVRIQWLKNYGFSLNEIKPLLALNRRASL